MTDLATLLISELRNTHYSTGDLPGIGGRLKHEPIDFCVEEIMPYEACGEGEHVYVTVQRESMTTPEVGTLIARCFRQPSREIGWAGMKDKHAVTTQTFSLRLGWHADLDSVRHQLEQITGINVLAVAKHRNKIKRGHVRVNRFNILVRDPIPDALNTAQNIAKALSERGVPNYFGEQRFSSGLTNIYQACAVLNDQHVDGRKDTFMVSVLQGALFNIWLNRRFDDGLYSSLVPGDIAQKTDTGGVFDVTDITIDQDRFDRREIIYTGPIFGHDMRQATGDAGSREKAILEELGVDLESFRALKAPGSRRAGIIFPENLNVMDDDHGIRVVFDLPSGAYATGVMREFMKPD